MAKKRDSFMGWLGRQIGHVKRAAKTPVPEVVYRKETVQEVKVDGTDHLLRRTTVDEVIVEKSEPAKPPSEGRPQ